jgi:hypothetical protein
MDIFSTAEAGTYLHTPPGTLRYWRHIGIGPRSARFGRRVVYLRNDLDAWASQEMARTGRGGTDQQIAAA